MTPRISGPLAKDRAEYHTRAWETLTREDAEGDRKELFWRYVFAPEGYRPDQMFTDAEYRTLAKGSSGGAFMVPESVEEQIVAAARAQSGIAQVALELRTETGESYSLPLASTLGAANWTTESSTYTASDEVFTQVALGAHKSTSLVVLSEELERDSDVPIDALLAMLAGGRLGALQATSFAVGTGTNQPLGIATAGSGYTTVVAATGSTVLFKGADLQAAYLGLPAAYRANASWIFHPDDYGKLAGTLDTAGAIAFPTLHQNPPTIFSRPVYVDAAMPAPAANARSAAFGDFAAGYAIRRVNGVGLQRLDEIRSDSGQLTFRANERLDGRPALLDAVRLLVHSAT